MTIRAMAVMAASCFAAVALADAAGAFGAKVTTVRISDRGNGEAYNVNVTTQGDGVGTVANVSVFFERGSDAPKPEERSHVLPLIAKNNRGIKEVAFPSSPKGQVLTVTATLRSKKGAALGTPQTFEVMAGSAAVEIDAPAERDRNGRIRRLRLHDAGTDDAGRPLVRHIVVGEGAMIDRVASVELRYEGGGPSAPVSVPLDFVQQKYRGVVIFEESAVGETLPVAITMQDAAGKPLGASHNAKIKVEPSKLPPPS